MAKNNRTIDRIQAIWNMIGGDEVADLLLEGRAKLVVKRILILDLRDTIITTSAKTGKFVANSKFCKENREVNFSGFWKEFSDQFLAGDGKIEEPLGEQNIRYGNLTKRSGDKLIIKELGGEAKAETTLTELYDLLKKQANGKKGVLLTNSKDNIFYIKNISGQLCRVMVSWIRSGFVGWGVGVTLADDSFFCWPGSRIFFRAA